MFRRRMTNALASALVGLIFTASASPINREAIASTRLDQTTNPRTERIDTTEVHIPSDCSANSSRIAGRRINSEIPFAFPRGSAYKEAYFLKTQIVKAKRSLFQTTSNVSSIQRARDGKIANLKRTISNYETLIANNIAIPEKKKRSIFSRESRQKRKYREHQEQIRQKKVQRKIETGKKKYEMAKQQLSDWIDFEKHANEIIELNRNRKLYLDKIVAILAIQIDQLPFDESGLESVLTTTIALDGLSECLDPLLVSGHEKTLKLRKSEQGEVNEATIDKEYKDLLYFDFTEALISELRNAAIDRSSIPYSKSYITAYASDRSRLRNRVKQLIGNTESARQLASHVKKIEKERSERSRIRTYHSTYYNLSRRDVTESEWIDFTTQDETILKSFLAEYHRLIDLARDAAEIKCKTTTQTNGYGVSISSFKDCWMGGEDEIKVIEKDNLNVAIDRSLMNKRCSEQLKKQFCSCLVNNNKGHFNKRQYNLFLKSPPAFARYVNAKTSDIKGNRNRGRAMVRKRVGRVDQIRLQSVWPGDLSLAYQCGNKTNLP